MTGPRNKILAVPTPTEMDTGTWGLFEHDRPRDPEWLTATTARTRRGEYERADCCWDEVRFVAEVPRQRQLSVTRIIDLAPARFRLCAHHADILLLADPQARIFEIGSIHAN